MAKIGIIGSGGREHALGWKFSQHGHFVYYFPGNGGTEMEFRGKNIKIDGTKEENFPIVYDFVEREKLDMLVVGPEGPLVKKIIDYFNYWGYKRIVGPTGIAAELESDKFFSYDLMKELEIGQADSVKCYSLEEARKAINERATDNGIVIKARGLTGGKGVTVCNSKKQALDIISEHIDKYGFHNLIAERLFGEEYSIFGISDGSIVLPLELSVQDFKRLQEDDKGPNTGGMGSYCPTPFASAQIIRDLTQKVMNPVVQRMKDKGREYKGIIYAGMILTNQGPKVLEFNIRFGDPETQPLMRMIKSDLYEVLSQSLEGKLDHVKIEFNSGAACCVVLASRGYPDTKCEEYKKSQGLEIKGLEKAKNIAGAEVFHAGTRKEGNNILTAGGRIFGVTGYNSNKEIGIFAARRAAYRAASFIEVPGGFHYRGDIAEKAGREIQIRI